MTPSPKPDSLHPPTGPRAGTGQEPTVIEAGGRRGDTSARRDARYDGATDEQVAATILADLNYKRLPYERALIVTTAHVRGIRESERRDDGS